MTMENIEKVIVTKSQVSGDGPRFLTDSDTKRVTIAGFLELYKNQGSLVIGNDEICKLWPAFTPHVVLVSRRMELLSQDMVV